MAFTSLFVQDHLFPAHSQLVLISPLAGGDLKIISELRSRGFHLLVISPNPTLFEYAALPKTTDILLAKRIVQMQRTVMLQRLRGLGVQVVDWDVSRPFEQVARRHLERHPAMARGVQP